MAAIQVVEEEYQETSVRMGSVAEPRHQKSQDMNAEFAIRLDWRHSRRPVLYKFPQSVQSLGKRVCLSGCEA